jgi:hypothetical protein
MDYLLFTDQRRRLSRNRTCVQGEQSLLNRVSRPQIHTVGKENHRNHREWSHRESRQYSTPGACKFHIKSNKHGFIVSDRKFQECTDFIIKRLI